MMKDLESVRAALHARPEGGSTRDRGAIETVAELVIGELESVDPA
jgi:hypothetical protein